MNGRNAALDKRAWAWATYGTTIEIGLCVGSLGWAGLWAWAWRGLGMHAW